MKITKYSFRDNKILIEELEVTPNVFNGRTSYRIKDDTHPLIIREYHLNKLRKSPFLTYYTFDKSFTKKDYLILIQDYLEERLKYYDSVINKATQDKAQAQNSLLIIYNERLDMVVDKIGEEK